MIVTLTGSNNFVLKEELQKNKADFINKYGQMAVEEVRAGEKDLDALIGIVQALPFLVEKRLVIIYDITENKQLAESVDTLLKAVSEQTELIIYQPKFDKRSVVYKALKKQTDFREFNELNEVKLVEWVKNYITQNQGKLSPADARYLIERIGLDQMRLKNELHKLLAYSLQIDRNNIDLLVEPNLKNTNFDMLEAALTGNSQKALKIYQQQRKAQVEPQLILGLIAWQLHILAVVATARSVTSQQIASVSKINPYVISKAQPLVKRLGLGQIKYLIDKSLDLDIKLKSQTIDADSALTNLLLEISIN